MKTDKTTFKERGLKLTIEEYAQLEEEAKAKHFQTLSGYMRFLLFNRGTA